MPEVHAEVTADADPARHAIASIHVRRLHGTFDYDLDLACQGAASEPKDALGLTAVNASRLTLLHGRNGTGKTSLATLLFHGLSADPRRDHRRTIHDTRFREFRVTFFNGDAVAYRRSDEAIAGPYTVETSIAGAVNQWRDEGGRPEPDRGEAEPLQALGALALHPTLLGESRACVSDLFEPAQDAQEHMLLAGLRGSTVEQIAGERRDAELERALDLVRDYLSKLVYQGTRQGTKHIHGMYLDAIDAIVAHAGPTDGPRKTTVPRLRQQVVAMGERVGEFISYGLSPEFPQQELLALLADAQDRHGPALEYLLAPYFEGFTQRLAALEPSLRAISTFVTTVNSFVEGKTFTFSTSSGSRIIDDETGEALAPTKLSSGEKQILLLLATLVAMRDSTALFIVDEPELSLDPEWQRMLAPTLLAVTQGSGMQLVAVTRSREMISPYLDGG